MENSTSVSFNTGDYVMYKTYGLCTIMELGDKDFGHGSRNYYTLKLVNAPQSIFYVPCDLVNIGDSIRSTINKNEILDSILEAETIDEIWNPNNKIRTLEYDNILSKGTIAQKLYIYKTLSQKKEESIKNKKKMYICDSKTLSIVEKLIKQEFSFVLNISQDEVVPFILDTIKNNVN